MRALFQGWSDEFALTAASEPPAVPRISACRCQLCWLSGPGLRGLRFAYLSRLTKATTNIINAHAGSGCLAIAGRIAGKFLTAVAIHPNFDITDPFKIIRSGPIALPVMDCIGGGPKAHRCLP